MHKRTFLKYITASGLLISQSSFAKSNTKIPKLLFIYLRGAADGLNFLAPTIDPLYYQYRPTLALEKSICLPINADFGMHPNFKDSLYSLYQQNQVIFFPTAGQLENSRSHFQAQDTMSYGVNEAHYSSGFLGRLGETLNTNCISFTETTRAIFSGKINVPTLSLKNLQSNSQQELEYLKSQFKPNSSFEQQFDNIIKYNEVTAKLNNNNPRFERIAKFMDTSEINIGYVELDSWDTHANQGSLHGEFGKLTKNLNDSLISFKSNTTQWDNTLVVIMSEFGRTTQENGSKGTDHGHGNLLTLCGGLIKKSAVAGVWNGLSDLHESRDLPVYHDYRNVLRKTLSQMYALNNKQLDYIFPNSINEVSIIL